MRVVTVLALLGSALGFSEANRIIGGSDTTIENYPYMANMEFGYFSTGWIQSCGGAIITNHYILSAVHCYNRWPAMFFRARLGSSQRTSGGSIHTVAQTIWHPDWNILPQDADIALVRLNDPAVFSDSVQPARIAGPNSLLPDGTPITAIGWGQLEHGSVHPEQLQHVEVQVINQELCVERYAYLKTQLGFSRWPDVTPGMLCSGILDVGGKDVCQGDSGGPVSYLAEDGHVVVGIVSWGYPCGDAFYPGVLARVSSYTDWIVNNAV